MPIFLIKIIWVIDRENDNRHFFADVIIVLQFDALCLTGTKHS